MTLAGGILPRIADLIDDAAFRAAFEDKAPVAALAKRIGTRLVTHTDSVLGGMAALAAQPERFRAGLRGAAVAGVSAPH